MTRAAARHRRTREQALLQAGRKGHVDMRGGDWEIYLPVAALALFVSLVAFGWFYRQGDALLYGDAVAHLNLARRLTDARTPGWDQIGSVWLPLPHLLAAPFVADGWLWRTGIGGSIPSMAAFVLGVVGVFRLVRGRASEGCAWLAAAIYGLNPSLVYMQATAMTESIFLAAMVWALVYLDAYLRGLEEGERAALPAWKALERCGICLAAAVFTRYDGWILAFVAGVCAGVAWLGWRRRHPAGAKRRRLLRSMFDFVLLLALCPALWLAHNYRVNQKPLDWLNGPYSAKAIEQRSSQPGAPPYPGEGHVRVAALYFLKAARMNTGEGGREMWLMSLAAAGALMAIARWRRFGAWLLLWLPLPFYAFSIAYGSVPIFVPEWWPFSYYNVRYGLELLPAVAVFVGVLPWGVARLAERWPAKASPAARVVAGVALCAVTLLGYSSSAWCFSRRSQDRDWGRRWMIPVCYREAWVNSRSRVALESQVAGVLEEMPANATVLMYTSNYVGALQQAGIPLKQVISEWSRFEWPVALSAPGHCADYVVAVAGDPVAEAVKVNPRGLTTVAILHTMGAPEVRIYRGAR